MRRFMVLLLLALLPFTLAPRLALDAPDGAVTVAVAKVKKQNRPGASVPFQVRVTNRTAADARAARIAISALRDGAATGLRFLSTSHGCTLGSAAVSDLGSGAFTGVPAVCTVNVPAGKTRVINGVLRATAPGAVTLTASVAG